MQGNGVFAYYNVGMFLRLVLLHDWDAHCLCKLVPLVGIQVHLKGAQRQGMTLQAQCVKAGKMDGNVLACA